MFEESLLESTALLRTRSRKPVYTAIAIQATLAAALLSLPLLHPELLPTHAPSMTLTAPPPPAPRPPEPPHVRVVNTASSAAAVAPVATLAPRIGTQFRPLPDVEAAPVPAGTALNMGSPNGSPWGSILGSPNDTIVAVAPAPAPRASGPTRISQGVMAGMLLAPIQPTYPPIARSAGIGGTVIVEAIISGSGRIERAHAVSGPAMLQAAAVDAVSRARYRPFLLNGSPVEVDTTVTVNFKLAN